jgi:hypothetical protein
VIPADYWRDIVGRTSTPAGVTRELSCGHFQAEQNGGRSRSAMRARCLECLGGAPVPLTNGATCSALIARGERRLTVCGSPAVTVKLGRPRCAAHARKGAR